MLAMKFNLSVSLLVILALTLASIGCSTAPVTEKPETKAGITTLLSSESDKYTAETEKSAAKAAMDNAFSCEADKYAEADMNAAKKIIENAEAKMKVEKYAEARHDYAAAKAAFNKAAVNAEEGRKMAAAEANAAIANLEKAWENLKAAYGNVKNKMRDGEMKSSWSAFTKSFAEDFKAIKEKIATDPAGTKANIDELMAIIERWETAFREINAASAKQKAVKTEAKPSKALKK
jgi:hypothetical protein